MLTLGRSTLGLVFGVRPFEWIVQLQYAPAAYLRFMWVRWRFLYRTRYCAKKLSRTDNWSDIIFQTVVVVTDVLIEQEFLVFQLSHYSFLNLHHKSVLGRPASSVSFFSSSSVSSITSRRRTFYERALTA